MKKYKQRYNNITLDIDNLNEIDYLNNIVYAKELKYIIDDYIKSKKTKPIYIALTGDWGNGKTTILNTYKSICKDQNTKIIYYDAWKYEEDSFKRDFIIKILDNSTIKKNSNKYKNELEGLYYDKTITNNHFNRSHLTIVLFIFYVLLFIFSIFILFYSLYVLFVDLKCNINGIKDISNFICKLFNIGILTNIMLYSVSYTRPKLFSSEQFYNHAKNLLKKNFDEENIVIMIDNIDRCNNSDFKKILSAIKGFFDIETNKKIVYIISFDKEQFIKVYSDKNSKNTSDYYEKIFDVSVDVKNITITNSIGFINKLINNKKEYSSLFPIEVKNIIAKSYINNPRKLLNLCNNYINEYNLFRIRNSSLEINDECLAYLMKYTILKVCFPIFFDEIHRNSYLFIEIENNINMINDSNYFDNADDKVKEFLKSTATILPKKYDYYYSNFNMDKYVIDMNNYINQKEYSKADKIVKNNKFIDYIIDNLMYDIVTNNWENNIWLKLRYIIYAINKELIPISITEKIKFVVKDSFFIENIINEKNNIEIDKVIDLLSKFKNIIRINQKVIDAVIENRYDEKEIIALIYWKLDLGVLDEKRIKDFNKFMNDIIESKECFEASYPNILLSDVVEYMTYDTYIKLLKNYNDNKLILENIITCTVKIHHGKNSKINNNKVKFEFLSFLEKTINGSNIIEIKKIIKENKEIKTILSNKEYNNLLSIITNSNNKQKDKTIFINN